MRTFLTIALVLGTFAVAAQNSAVVNAYNYMQDGELAKAAGYIEPAIANETTMGKEKTWRYRGNIYQQIAMGEDAALKEQFPDAMDKAIESYLEAVELDTKDAYRSENIKALGALQGASLNAGNAAFGTQEYDKAIAYYDQSQRIAKAFGQVDTNAIFNSALAYETKGDAANAIARYRSCLELGYDKPEVYRYLATLQAKEGDLDGAITTTRQGRAKHPDSAEMLKDELIYLLRAGRDSESEGVLDEALARNPNDAVLWSIKGSLYDAKANPKEGEAPEEAVMLENYSKAEDAYKKAISADPSFFDAYFNIGVLHNNRAAYEYEKCSKIKSDVEYTKCKAVADEIYLAAVPYFEKAYELKPDDVQTIQQLMKLYAKTNDQDKYKAMKEKLDN